jgi:hypothetical protein
MAKIKHFATALAFTACAGNVSTNYVNAAPTLPTKDALVTLEKSGYQAWKSKDATFWDTFLSDKFVGEAEMCEHVERVVREHVGTVEKFLKLRRRFGSLMAKQIRLPPHIRGIKQDSKFDVRHIAQLIGNRDLEKFDGPGGIAAVNGNGCPDGRQPVIDDDRILRGFL